MSTAHRPTWAPAKGGEEQGGMRIFKASLARSAKDLAGHTKLKFRQTGQNSGAELQERDFRAELESKEKEHLTKTKGISFEEEREQDLLLLEAGSGDAGKAKQLQPRQLDADEEDDTDGESSSDSDDDDDEEALLLAELERIKREREADARKRAQEEVAAQQKEKEQEFAAGNPLMSAAAGEPTFAVKRRWDEDVVFKNQARGEPKQQKRFINDTIRSDFHRRFLERYVK